MSANPPSSNVFDATEANFQVDVLDASFKHAVLVDLWATWCEPCKILGPLLERVVDEYNGALSLAKVDCDSQPQLAAMFGARSIPTVVLIRDGQLVDAFTGALPESGIREFLARHVQPSQANPDADEASEPLIEETAEQAIERLEQAIVAQPATLELRLDLAVARMRAGDAPGAQTELDALPATLEDDERARRVRYYLDFNRALEGAPSAADLHAAIERDPMDLQAHDLLGVRLLVDGDASGGLDQFLAVLKADRNWNDGAAKKRLIAAFSVLDDAELVGSYRRRMSSLLF